MTIATLRPNGVVATSGAPTITGGGTYDSATNDSSDVTYVTFPDSGGAHSVELTFDTVSIPLNAQIRSVTPYVRHNQSTDPFMGRRFAMSVDLTSFPVELLAKVAGFQTQAGFTRVASNAPRYFPDSGRLPVTATTWIQDDIDALSLRVLFQLIPPYHPAFDVADVWIDVLYNEAMIPVGSAPNATVATTQPRWEWTVTDSEGDLQERFRLKVFADYQYEADGFDPNTTAPLADSGEVFSADAHWTAPVSFYSGHTYRAFIWTADAGSNGRYNTVAASGPYAYATVDRTGTGTPLAAPSLILTAPASPGDPVEIIINGADNELSSQTADFEAPTDGSDVGDWVAVENCALSCLSGLSDANSGTGVMQLVTDVLGDALALTAIGTDGVPATQERFGAVSIKAAVTSRQVRAELHWFDADGTEIDVTVGNTTFDGAGVWTQCFVFGSCIYPTDARYVALGVRVFGAVAGEHHEVDAARVSPNPINNMLTPGFDSDANSDGLADDWALVNTSSDPDPIPSIDRVKVWGGVASQRLDWSGSSAERGIEQTLDIPSGAVKLIQVWVAIECAVTPNYVLVSHDHLPDVAGGPVAIPPDGEFYPITMMVTNTGSFGLGTLKIVSLQGGTVTMWVGGVVVYDVDPHAASPGGTDWGGLSDGEGFVNGGPKDVMSGFFSHGGGTAFHHYELQRSLDSGRTWATVSRVATNPTDWRVTNLADVEPVEQTQALAAYDFEAPALVPVMYRGRSIATLPGNQVLTSNWSQWHSIVTASPGWLLSAITKPDVSLLFDPPLTDLEWKIAYGERGGVEHPLGREFEVVMSDAVTGAHIPFEATFTTEDEYAIYTALRKLQKPMLLRTPWGEQFYVRFVGQHDIMRIVDGDTQEIKRVVDAALVEIDVP